MSGWGFLRKMNQFSQVTFAFASAMAVSLAIGFGLDRWLGTERVYTTVFFVLGVLTGLKSLHRTVQDISKELDKKE